VKKEKPKPKKKRSTRGPKQTPKMPVIPVINKDLGQVTKEFNEKIHEPKHQRNLVLIIVCIALLLDNMLYMVIVPIIPEYLSDIDAANAVKLSTVTAHQQPFNNRLTTLDPKLLARAKLANATRTTATPDSEEEESEEEDDSTQLTTTRKVYRGRVVVRTTSSIGSSRVPTTSTTTLSPLAAAKLKQEANEEDVVVGYLFASKAMVQLLVNPFSGAFIDRIGYDVPMCIGLSIIFLSTMTFSFGGSYFMLFLARSMQGVGSAFADTSGLAMIADRFTEEGNYNFPRFERNA
jgi:DHA1 family vesicular acetylcholine transporter-like MFS transporter 3